MNPKNLLYILPLAATITACSAKSTTYTEPVASPQQPVPSPRQPHVVSGKLPAGSDMAIPKATAFRMNGDYSQNVAITLSEDGRVIYYPAPTDISPASAPVRLDNGWWLNRQGIGSNSVFTSFTFSQYAALPAPPSEEQLKEAVIPGAKVTDMIQLPVSINEAPQQIEEINLYLQTLSHKNF